MKRAAYVLGAVVLVPLGPRAVTEHVLGIFERTLKLPGKLVVPAPEAK